MYKIAVIGTGYVGLTTAVGLAAFGSQVLGLDIDDEKITMLKNGEVPFYEPGMQAAMDAGIKAKRLSFSSDIDEGIKWADIIFIGVGTPQSGTGRADLRAVFAVAETIGQNLNNYKIIITKSTVSVGTNEKISAVIAETSQGNQEFDIVSNPEFLREGNALQDFLRPERVIIGVASHRPLDAVKKIYRPLYLDDIPFVITDLRTAEMIKYASNCYLASRVAFINEMARLCDAVGANVQLVAQGMGHDSRIGKKFLHAGPGYGGSCFPKDTYAMASLGKDYDVDLPLIKATIASNDLQKKYAAEKVRQAFGQLTGKNLAVLGLAFKAETDDMRDSPAIVIINELLSFGASVSVYDPQAMSAARSIWERKIRYAQDEYDAVRGSDGVLILADWNQFRSLDILRMVGQMKEKYFFDFRNIYSPQEIEQHGAVYFGMGICAWNGLAER